MIVSAQSIATGLGARWRGHQAMACCPAHKDGTPSLSIGQTRDGRPLVRCFGGCEQMAVIDALRSRGLWPDGPLERDPAAPAYLTTRPDGLDIADRKRRAAGLDIWRSALPIAGTLAETYLRRRGITGPLPACLRFAPRLKHSDSGYWMPALVGLIVTGLGEPTAVQRIYLSDDGWKPEASPRKKTLGPMLDGAVRLAEPRDTLGLAESIEDAMSAKILFRIPTWAALGAARLRKVTLPADLRQLVIFADNGEVGLREAHAAAEHYRREHDDLLVMIRPPDEPHGDHNEWLLAGAREAA